MSCTPPPPSRREVPARHWVWGLLFFGALAVFAACVALLGEAIGERRAIAEQPLPYRE